MRIAMTIRNDTRPAWRRRLVATAHILLAVICLVLLFASSGILYLTKDNHLFNANASAYMLALLVLSLIGLVYVMAWCFRRKPVTSASEVVL